MTLGNCPTCGANMDMVGIRHRCIPSSRGGAESRRAKTGNKSGAAPEAEKNSSATSFVRVSREGLPLQARAGLAPGPRDDTAEYLRWCKIIADAPSPSSLGGGSRTDGGAAPMAGQSVKGSTPAVQQPAQAGPREQKLRAALIAARDFFDPTVNSKMVAMIDEALACPGPRETKRGRPLAKDRDKTLTATKPWVAEGISERTWYRRQKEKAAK